MLRNLVGQDCHLVKNNSYAPLWIVDFPLFEMDKNGDLLSVHHPFTAPITSITEEHMLADPKNITADAYDLVRNGYEVGGGSVRISNSNMQKTIFTILGIDDKTQQQKFGFLLEALSYGAPQQIHRHTRVKYTQYKNCF